MAEKINSGIERWTNDEENDIIKQIIEENPDSNYQSLFFNIFKEKLPDSTRSEQSFKNRFNYYKQYNIENPPVLTSKRNIKNVDRFSPGETVVTKRRKINEEPKREPKSEPISESH